MTRDRAADGTFVFAARTTGIYCRPSCGARRPRRENVQFFADGDGARAAGFRACKRCRPDAHDEATARARLVEQVCRWIAAAEIPPRLANLAARAGYSTFHLRRLFTDVLGMSPRAFAEACRSERLRSELATGRTVTAAMNRAGYGSSSRLHAAAANSLGMLPKRARNGGAGERIDYAIAGCSLGQALIAMTARGVCAVALGEDPARLRAELGRRFPAAELHRADRRLRARIRSVVAVVDGRRLDPGLPLDLRGTSFQQRVWLELQRIPRGAAASYAEVARRIGSPRGARAVARACAANAIAVLVPCHRVARGDGSGSGYRWGASRKRALLDRERRTNRADAPVAPLTPADR